MTVCYFFVTLASGGTGCGHGGNSVPYDCFGRPLRKQ